MIKFIKDWLSRRRASRLRASYIKGFSYALDELTAGVPEDELLSRITSCTFDEGLVSREFDKGISDAVRHFTSTQVKL